MFYKFEDNYFAETQSSHLFLSWEYEISINRGDPHLITDSEDT